MVAALTIPTLMANYRKSVVEKKIYTTYNILQNTVRMSAVDNGDPLFWNLDNLNSDIFEQYFAPYLNIVKRCKITNFEKDDDECATVFTNINEDVKGKAHTKYILSNDETLETYEISEGVVNVVANGDLYYLECNGINLSINVEDRMIIDYKVR